MVKAKPAPFLNISKLREALVDGRPVAEFLQTGRTAFPQSLIQVKHPLIVDVVIEIHIDLQHRIGQKKPADLREGVFPGIRVMQDSPQSQGRLQKDFHCIFCQPGLMHNLRNGPAPVTQNVEYSLFHHHPCDLKNYGTECNDVSEFLGGLCRQPVFSVYIHINLNSKNHSN